ncbi:MAG: TRAP transporter small permease [Planctomycetota bacterium]|jgi:TRAP-type C4-dicarboxylate transport system permease small subunit|nr:TRAP transporter small permease [Planctomycetota bacterium]
MALIDKTIGRLLTAGMSIAFLGLVGSVLLQVFARWFLPKVPSWTEESSRMFLIWLVGFGGGLAYRHGSYVNVDLLINLFPAWLRRFLTRLGDLIIALFMILFTWQAWLQTIRMGLRQTSSALDLPMQYIFFALCVLGAGVVLYSLLRFFLGSPAGEEKKGE